MWFNSGVKSSIDGQFSRQLMVSNFAVGISYSFEDGYHCVQVTFFLDLPMVNQHFVKRVSFSVVCSKSVLLSKSSRYNECYVIGPNFEWEAVNWSPHFCRILYADHTMTTQNYHQTRDNCFLLFCMKLIRVILVLYQSNYVTCNFIKIDESRGIVAILLS